MKANFLKEAVLLVAGKGERLQPHTNDQPKPLTEINKVSILERTLENLAAFGVQSVHLVTGYMNDKVMQFAHSHSNGMKIYEIFSSEYECTNNMYSLWLARDILLHGCLLLEGDVFFESSVLSDLYRVDGKDSYWLADRFTQAHDGCMLETSDDGIIQKLKILHGEKLLSYDNCFKSIGILAISEILGEKFSVWLQENIDSGQVGVYYDLILADHLREANIHVLNIHGRKWAEIDDFEDLKQAEKLFKR